LILSLAALSACGYALVGRGTVVDPTIKKIAVPLFKDSTGKPGLDQKITQKVVEELLKRGRFDVTSERIRRGCHLGGRAPALRPDAGRLLGRGRDATQASRYLVTLTARVRYIKVGQEEPIWANESFSFRDEYDVGSDPTAFFDQQGQAVERLSTAFARSLVAAMLEAF
jgi:hypothetical protein